MLKRYLTAKIYDADGVDHPSTWADAVDEIMVTRYADQLAIEYQSDPDGDGRPWEVHIAIDQPMLATLMKIFNEFPAGAVTSIDPKTEA